MATGDVGISNEKRQSISRKTARALASKWKAAYRNICENGGNLGERKLKAWRKSAKIEAAECCWRRRGGMWHRHQRKAAWRRESQRGGRSRAAWRKMGGYEEKRRTGVNKTELCAGAGKPAQREIKAAMAVMAMKCMSKWRRSNINLIKLTSSAWLVIVIQ
jgi:hypothetical protein